MNKPTSSDVFIKAALEQLSNAKEAKKLTQLKDACKLALDSSASSKIQLDKLTLDKIFLPFQLACDSRLSPLVSISIDCLGKLFSYNYWGRHEYNVELQDSDLLDDESDSPSKNSITLSRNNQQRKSGEDDMQSGDSEKGERAGGIMATVIDAICDSFSGGENTDEKVQMQIVKALLASVTSTDPASAVHGAVLLKAIRTTYNIFLLSKSANTQIIAQATLTQMVQAVYGRLPKEGTPIPMVTTEDPINKVKENSGDGETIVAEETPPSIKRSGSTDSLVDDAVKEAKSPKKSTTNDIHIKDAYLVFRALCKLSMKPIPVPEGSKLLSLHLINTIVSVHLSFFYTHAPVLFSVPTQHAPLFIHAVKQFLCLSLSRNAASVVPQVFDTAMDIFGRILIGLRTLLKKELSVIFTEIIIPIIEARSTVTFHQRTSVLKLFHKILADPTTSGGRLLVEIYLNYDCDVESSQRENIWERLISALSKVNTTLYTMDPSQAPSLVSHSEKMIGVVPAITTATLTSFTREQVKELYSSTGDYMDLKKRGLEVLVKGVLGPLVQWCNERIAEKEKKEHVERKEAVVEEEEVKGEGGLGKRKDDPMAFENMKQRKQVLLEGIKRFNFKPKKGMQFLIDSGCIPSKSPVDIGQFLLNTEGLNKSMIGEYLGEGEVENIAIMHAFVDEMDFYNTNFTDALRSFLQSFRLPGEAQKIDRFMLKFAERYVKGNPSSFSSADTAYVLSYSVIMLNTDQYNPQVKKRMTKQDFIKNNRGIDEGKDIDPSLLEGIFDEIASNEIVMKDEQLAKYDNDKNQDGKNDEVQGRYRTKKEIAQIAIANETMALKTEAMFNTIRTKSGSSNKQMSNNLSPSVSTFYNASHYEHVKSMFQLIWMSILTGISTPLQETDDIDTIFLSLEGFKYACRICCLFDMELERKAFITTFSKFTYITSLHDMRAKNLEAIRTLLDIAYLEGDHLGESWREVVLCISQLEKLQLVSSEGEEELQRVQRTSTSTETTSQNMALAVDRIFTSSVKLSGKAIVDFVRALCIVSWDEISSPTGDTLHPRMHSLQRLIEISYYNMKRIRVEWSNLWAILGEHFNQVGCHPNSVIGFFALDKMRQLATKFLEIDELANFKFQKDFLKPFDYILGNNPDPKIKDMILACLQQMIQAKSGSIKSGWKSMFAAFAKAAKESHEPVVVFAFDIVKNIYKNQFESVLQNGTFSDLISCLVEFCKNRKFGKTSLQSIELIRLAIARVAEMSKPQENKLSSRMKSILDIGDGSAGGSPAGPLIPLTYTNCLPSGVSAGFKISADEDPNIRFWFPTLFGLYEIIMTCDLEVRTRALTYLFDSLKNHGGGFSKDFWEVVAKGVLFPIFDDLKLSRQEHTKFANKDDMSVWLSTTLIQALRQFVDLFGVFFETLDSFIDGLLDLLTICMTQENETLARIGSTCLHQFIENNVEKMTEETWLKVCNMFVHLFKVTTPHSLFLDSKSNPESSPEEDDPNARKIPEKKDFHSIIVKCVLHLLVIQTLHEVLAVEKNNNDNVYKSLSSPNLLTLIDCLERSYRFAQSFNNDMELRQRLFRMGFMKQLPNLLKQETSSVTSYISILIKMYSDLGEERKGNRDQIAKRLIPLSYDILTHYNSLEPESKKRNVTAWRPVVVTILNALVNFDDEQFSKNMPVFYEQIINLLFQELSADIRLVMHSIMLRTGILFKVMATRNTVDDDVQQKAAVTFSEIPEETTPVKDGFFGSVVIE